MAYAEVLLPLPLRGVYTYRLVGPYAHPVQVGARVQVPFGSKNHYAGVVVRLDAEPVASAKAVEAVLDPGPALYPETLRFYFWLADYYAAAPGDVLKVALPTGLKLDNVRYLVAGQAAAPSAALPLEVTGPLNDLVAFLQQGHAVVEPELETLFPATTAQRQIEAWVRAGQLAWATQAEARYRPKTLRGLALSPSVAEPGGLDHAFAALKRAPQQEALLLVVAEAYLAGHPLPEATALGRIGASPGVAAGLVGKGFVQRIALPVSRLATGQAATTPPPELTAAQQTALAALLAHLEGGTPTEPVLLHGVTGSGKTLLLQALAARTLAQGQQVLYLVPEIGLTAQAIERWRARFGALVGLAHSRLSEAERVETWQAVLRGDIRIVLGARSALLLPFAELGLILVDEAHDRSYKQAEPAPRYHARDAAVHLGQQLGIPVVLSTATPSLETYLAATEGRMGYVPLTERPFPGPMPSVELINMRQQQAERSSDGPFSAPLLDALRVVVASGQQALVLKNRRGFSPLVVCTTCGHVPHCPNCDISLTLHQAARELRCHYCGYRDTDPTTCTNCHHPTLRPEGMGTERIEELLRDRLPGARIGRMDLDTTRGKAGFERVIGQFARGELDVLVGTQMVTKGLDFGNVSLAAVLSADSLLHYPDFRATEHAYQLLTQFAGRAGRAGQPSRLLIQTYQPEHPFWALLQAPYTVFAEAELHLRLALSYPPYSRLIQLELRHRDLGFLQTEALRLAALLRPWLGGSLMGPEAPAIARVKGYFRLRFLIRASAKQSGRGLKQRLEASLAAYRAQAPNQTVRTVVDVDPYS